MRPTDVPDQGLLCDLLWSDPDKDTMGWGENDRGVSFTFGAEVVAKFLHKHDFDLICRAHQVHGHDHDNLTSVLMWPLLQVVEDGYEFFAKRQLVTLFSAPNYCGEFDNAGMEAAAWLFTSQPLDLKRSIEYIHLLQQIFTVLLSRCHDVCGRNSDVLLPNLETCRQKEVPLRRPERGQTSDSPQGGHRAESQGEEVRVEER